MKTRLQIWLHLCIILFTIYSCEQSVSTSPEKPKPINSSLLFVDSKPQGASIYLNGSITGHITPDTIPWIDEGTYKLTLKLQYYKDTSIIVTVKENQITSYFLDYTTNPSMRGHLYCDSNPTGALIYINDSLTGKLTPDLISGLLPGYYKIRLTKHGYWDAEMNAVVQSSIINYIPTQYLIDSTVWVLFNSNNSELQFDYLGTIAVQNGYIKWIGTPGEGIIRFDDKTWTHFNPENSPLPHPYINDIKIDKNDVWICTVDGLAKFNGLVWEVFDKINTGLPDNYITSIAIAENGEKWIGTFYNGIVKSDGDNWEIFNQTNSPLPSNTINSIIIDKYGFKWIATEDGLVKAKSSSFRTWEVFRKENLVLNTIPDNFVNAIQSDNYGNIWISTLKGVAVYNGEKWYNTEIPTSTSIAVDRNNTIWFASKGIYQYKNGIVRIFDSHNSPLKTDKIMSLTIDGNNNLWATTFGNGLVKYKGN